MTRRMIDSAMWSNENFAALPVMARLLQVGIINMADDQGRVKAFPAYLRSQIFPYDDVAIADISKWLHLIAKNGTIQLYQAEGKEYIQLLKWWEYQNLQYPAPSEYPAPPEWRDHVRYNAKGGMVLTYNWITIKGERLPDTCDARGVALGYSLGRLPDTPLEAPIDNPPVIPPETPGENPGEMPLEAPIQLEDQVQNNTDQPKGDEEEDARERNPIEAAWHESYGEDVPDNLKIRLGNLATECGPEAVAHAIHASKSADARNFRYIAQCARNYLPPAPPTTQNNNYANGNGYHVDLADVPGVVHLQPTGAAPPALPPPMAHDDPWAIALAELLPTLPGVAKSYLAGSTLVEAGMVNVDGQALPLYRVVVEERAAVGVDWLVAQAGPAIRKKMSGVLRQKVAIEIVVAEAVKEPA